VLDAVRDSGKVQKSQMPSVVGRISFFVNGGVRFIEEIAKMRTFTAMWTRSVARVTGSRIRRFVASATACRSIRSDSRTATREHVQRIVLEMLGLTLSADARARAIQLPAWNEALGLPRPGTNSGVFACSSPRLRERPARVPDIFAGSQVMDAKVRELTLAAKSNSTMYCARGAFAAIENQESTRGEPGERVARIESGEQIVVGVNRFTETTESPLTSGPSLESIMTSIPTSSMN